ncbi:NUDIX domain-containing protein [Candidatus Pandoraea novymonadis]|uniref:8-oxo-dGTP diphosphatase n=1 Tax=Candidatus Pandoraea novymonadis TaxID=1808959 RepID=A0ABX5FFD2_9BURK|nr:NUDIX domain-containing protein [Candidatus Pandoraea novymonadis]PSB92424.1 8-oxo-dGTP diphosphatase [Candidatus Pandoraea novymonadis]
MIAAVINTALDRRPVIEVAVGIMIDQPDDVVLLGQRPAGKSYAGYWEFPGGKIEVGETVEAALERELHEELGVTVKRCERWKVLEHCYPHAHVRLYFCKVRAWTGVPHGREGQVLMWQKPPFSLVPLLPTVLSIVNFLVAELVGDD